MRRSFGTIISLCSLLLVLIVPQGAFADSLASNGQPIVITATVAAERFVVVSDDGTILQITSNNSLSNAPVQVYRNSIIKANQIAATPTIISKTNILLGNIVIKPGVLYTRAASAMQVQISQTILPLLIHLK